MKNKFEISPDYLEVRVVGENNYSSTDTRLISNNIEVDSSSVKQALGEVATIKDEIGSLKASLAVLRSSKQDNAAFISNTNNQLASLATRIDSLEGKQGSKAVVNVVTDDKALARAINQINKEFEKLVSKDNTAELNKELDKLVTQKLNTLAQSLASNVANMVQQGVDEKLKDYTLKSSLETQNTEAKKQYTKIVELGAKLNELEQSLEQNSSTSQSSLSSLTSSLTSYALKTDIDSLKQEVITKVDNLTKKYESTSSNTALDEKLSSLKSDILGIVSSIVPELLGESEEQDEVRVGSNSFDTSSENYEEIINLLVSNISSFKQSSIPLQTKDGIRSVSNNDLQEVIKKMYANVKRNKKKNNENIQRILSGDN